MATNEKEPGVRHLFKVGDTNSTQPWTCLTCKPQLGPNRTHEQTNNTSVLTKSLLLHYRCEFNNVIFSVSYKYYVQECLGPTTPVVFLVETATNTRLAVLDNGATLWLEVRKYSMPQIKEVSVIIEDGFEAQVKLYLPPILREYEDAVFPTILIV